MYINKFKKIVIKIGSSILIDEKGKPKKIWLQEFAKSIKNLIKEKKQIVIVSSGAIAMRLSIVRFAFIDLLLCSVSSSVSNI